MPIPFDFTLYKYLTMMTDLCPICNITVDNSCLQCDKCNDWMHYSCSKLPTYLIIQLSKSTRVFTCHSCVKSKYPLAFQKLHDDIEKIIMSPVNQSSSPIKPTTPSAPASPLFIQLTPTPLIPSAPSNFSPVISSCQHISPTPMIHPTSPNHPPPIPISCPLVTTHKRNHVNSICNATVCMI